jgi:hypothetical protein
MMHKSDLMIRLGCGYFGAAAGHVIGLLLLLYWSVMTDTLMMSQEEYEAKHASFTLTYWIVVGISTVYMGVIAWIASGQHTKPDEPKELSSTHL